MAHRKTGLSWSAGSGTVMFHKGGRIRERGSRGARGRGENISGKVDQETLLSWSTGSGINTFSRRARLETGLSRCACPGRRAFHKGVTKGWHLEGRVGWN